MTSPAPSSTTDKAAKMSSWTYCAFSMSASLLHTYGHCVIPIQWDPTSGQGRFAGSGGGTIALPLLLLLLSLLLPSLSLLMLSAMLAAAVGI